MIKLTGVSKVFFPGTPNEVLALDDLNLQVNTGEFVTIIGSNGAGKSTFLKTVAGLEQPDHGRVELAGKDVTGLPEFRRAKDIGRIDQDPTASTAAEMTIEENLAMACLRGKYRGLARAITKEREQFFPQSSGRDWSRSGRPAPGSSPNLVRRAAAGFSPRNGNNQ